MRKRRKEVQPSARSSTKDMMTPVGKGAIIGQLRVWPFPLTLIATSGERNRNPGRLFTGADIQVMVNKIEISIDRSPIIWSALIGAHREYAFTFGRINLSISPALD